MDFARVARLASFVYIRRRARRFGLSPQLDKLGGKRRGTRCGVAFNFVFGISVLGFGLSAADILPKSLDTILDFPELGIEPFSMLCTAITRRVDTLCTVTVRPHRIAALVLLAADEGCLDWAWPIHAEPAVMTASKNDTVMVTHIRLGKMCRGR